MTDLPDAADRAHNVPYSEQANAEMQRVYAENKRLRERVDFLEAAAGWASEGWSGILKKAFGIKKQRGEARAERDELRADNERLRRELLEEAHQLQDAFEDIERLEDQLSAAHDEIRRLHDAGMDASGDAVDWRARAVEQERQAARLRKHVDNLETVLEAETNASLIYQESLAQVSCENEKLRANDPGLSRLLAAALRQCEGQLREARAERDGLQAQLDDGLDDCLEMHAEYVAVKRERDSYRAALVEIRTEAETRIDDTRAVWAAWLLARIDDVLNGDTDAPERTTLPAGIYKSQRDACRKQRDKWHAAAVQGYRLMRAVERHLGQHPTVQLLGWADAPTLRDLVRRYREGRL